MGFKISAEEERERKKPASKRREIIRDMYITCNEWERVERGDIYASTIIKRATGGEDGLGVE